MKYYLPIIDAQNVYIEEIEIHHAKKFRVLDVLYENLNCSLVEKIPFDNKYDFIIDEEGLYKKHEFAYKISNYPNEFKDHPFVGKSTLVKQKITDEGIEWELFKDYKELSEVLTNNFQEMKVYQIPNNLN